MSKNIPMDEIYPHTNSNVKTTTVSPSHNLDPCYEQYDTPPSCIIPLEALCSGFPPTNNGLQDLTKQAFKECHLMLAANLHILI